MSQESTQVGFRLRNLEPPDLSTYPDSIKLMFWGWVVDLGLKVKDKELARGWDKNGVVHPLSPKTIRYRKSEVGPVTKTAPRLIPALELSRVRSLLRGRQHLQSAEYWWAFDPVSGASFAKILLFAKEKGHDVFGITPGGIARIRSQALERWEAWKASPEAQRLTAGRPGIPTARQVRKPVPKVMGRTDLENFDLFPGAKPVIEKAIEAGRFTGFRRLNAQGEKWTPGHGLGPVRRPPPAAPPALQPAPSPLPTFGPSPATVRVDPDDRRAILASIKKVLGPGATPTTAATLAGAPKGTTATVFRSGYSNENLMVYIEGQGVSVKRELQTTSGKLVIDNINVFLADDKQGHGLGTEILGRQIEAAQQAGVQYLRTAAAGSPDDRSMIGYKIWPKFGYDGELRDVIRWKLPESLKDCKRISDLYATADGRAWWAANGETIGLKFDLTPGSYSMRVWEAYLRERQNRTRTP